MIKYIGETRRDFFTETNEYPVAVEMGRVEYRRLLSEQLQTLQAQRVRDFGKEIDLERELICMTGKLGILVFGMEVRLVEIESLLRLVKE